MHYSLRIIGYWVGLVIDPEDLCDDCQNLDSRDEFECDRCRRKWHWLDNSDLNERMHQQWLVNQPDNDALCGGIRDDGLWFDAPCNDESYYVCKRGKYKNI